MVSFVFDYFRYFPTFRQSSSYIKHQIDILTSGKVFLSDILYNETALFYFMEVRTLPQYCHSKGTFMVRAFLVIIPITIPIWLILALLQRELLRGDCGQHMVEAVACTVCCTLTLQTNDRWPVRLRKWSWDRWERTLAREQCTVLWVYTFNSSTDPAKDYRKQQWAGEMIMGLPEGAQVLAREQYCVARNSAQWHGDIPSIIKATGHVHVRYKTETCWVLVSLNFSGTSHFGVDWTLFPVQPLFCRHSAHYQSVVPLAGVIS